MGEVRHRADGLFDRDFRIDAMLVIEIDVIDAKSLERRVAGLPHVRGVAANAEAFAFVFLLQVRAGYPAAVIAVAHITPLPAIHAAIERHGRASAQPCNGRV